MKSEYDKYLSIAKHKIEHLERKKRQKTPNTHANAEKGGRDFFGSIYIEHLERKKCQKMPKGYNVKYVTFDCSKKVTTINIYLQQNIKIEHLERKKCQKMPKYLIANVEKGLGI